MITGRRLLSPGRDLLNLGLRDYGHRFQFELAFAFGAHFAESLQADVVAASLEDRPAEVDVEVLGEERKVLLGELVLQCFGRCRDDDTLASGNGRHEVGKCLARTGSCLHDEVFSGGNGLFDETRHFELARTVFRILEGGSDGGERTECSSWRGAGRGVAH